jgi:hypothetical protein
VVITSSLNLDSHQDHQESVSTSNKKEVGMKAVKSLLIFIKKGNVKMKALILVVLLVLTSGLLSACGKMILLKGPKEDVVQCKGEYGFFGGQIKAEMEARSCAREYESAGYKRIK